MYVNADSVYIEEITPSVAKKMIIEKHYTHAFSMCRYALGIYYVGEQDHKFYDEKEKKLIGCMTYGYPVGRSAVKSMIPTLEKEEVLELIDQNQLILIKKSLLQIGKQKQCLVVCLQEMFFLL